MIKALLFDFSRTLLFPKDKTYKGNLNALHRQLSQTPGYDFLANFELNEEMFTFLNNIKDKYRMYMYTSESIQDTPEIKDKVDSYFDKIYSAEQIMLEKSDPESYKKLAEMIGLPIQDILFIDDLSVNIAAAKLAGMEVHQYIDNKGVFDKLNSLE